MRLLTILGIWFAGFAAGVFVGLVVAGFFMQMWWQATYPNF